MPYSNNHNALVDDLNQDDSVKIVAELGSDNKVVDSVIVIKQDKSHDTNQETIPAKADAAPTLADKPNTKTDSPDNLVDNLTDNLMSKTGELSSQMTAPKDDLANQANTDNNHKDKSYTTKSGLLGKIGAYLSPKNTKTGNQKHYKRADLTQAFNLKDNVFYGQGASFGQQVFGVKGAAAHKFASKVVSQERLDGIVGVLYHKIAHIAKLWAIKSLSNDERFDRLSTLTYAQKDAFAQDIANQNRALATLGGAAGFFGLKGVVADTAWLLVVSLRTVYQLAGIYGVSPANTKDSIQLAYGVLSAANLDKLQEKQVILTALALGNTMLANTSANPTDNSKAHINHGIFANYADELSELAKYIHLEKYNLQRFSTGWLSKLLPLSAVGVGAYYNRELIDEVIGTALATFAVLDNAPNLLDTPKSGSNTQNA